MSSSFLTTHDLTSTASSSVKCMVHVAREDCVCEKLFQARAGVVDLVATKVAIQLIGQQDIAKRVKKYQV